LIADVIHCAAIVEIRRLRGMHDTTLVRTNLRKLKADGEHCDKEESKEERRRLHIAKGE
jgi:hypothetical protein